MPARAGAAYLCSRRSQPLRRSGRNFDRSHRLCRVRALSRKASLHPSRPQRPGRIAGLFLLAPRPAGGDRPRARPASGPIHSAPKYRSAISPAPAPHFAPYFLIAWQTAGWRYNRLLHGPTRASPSAETALHRWTVYPAGTEGYEKAEVTAGGVDTAELSARTMESRNVPGLYFIGEVVDVTGHLGGFNFQWAWASGAAAGRALAGQSYRVICGTGR